MEQSLCVLGRQPALGLTELESLYGASVVRPAGAQAALLDLPTKGVDFGRLGGSTRLCEVLAVIESDNWHEIEAYLLKTFPQNLPASDGKLQLGLSALGLNVSVPQLSATGLKLKKVIRSTGRSVRITPNQTLELSSAQVTHNHLTGLHGWELILVQANYQTIVARTVAVQDIASYTLRDRGRPKRDTRIGMLPPKLAQIIINLAAAGKQNGGVLDPFCGTGVILQEALLMDYDVYGTDLEQRMIDYSQANLNWFKADFLTRNSSVFLAQADATAYHWQQPFDFVASETYLGRPFTTTPGAEVLSQTASECNLIIKKFLRNIAPQIPAKTRLCLAVPAWQIRPGQFKHLPLVDQIEEIGYNRVSFKHVRSNALLYYREDQIVARELLVITRK